MIATIGVDVGGTSTQAVLRNEDGAVTATARIPTQHPGGPAAVRSILSAIERLEHGESNAIGIGVPGQVDTVHGTVRWAVNLGIDDRPFPLADAVGRSVDVPVIVENDVRAAAFGVYQSLRNQGEDVSDLALLSLGTGISAGVVIDGALLRGSTGMAGEVGHVVVDPEGNLCRCGQRGCLETVASGPAIAGAWSSSSQDRTGSDVFRAATEGDTGASAVARNVTGHLARAIQWIAAAYDVETIILAGGVAVNSPTFLEMVRYALGETAGCSQLARRLLAPDRIRLVAPDSYPGACGAALLAARQQELLPQRKESKPKEEIE